MAGPQAAAGALPQLKALKRLASTPQSIARAAFAVLLAASAGGLLALARPGTVAVGVCALTLFPLSALVFAGAARAATIAAALVYVGALVWAYTRHFSPLYAYYGLTDARPHPSATLVTTALAALPAAWLPLAARRPSTIVLWFLYLVGCVPTIVVPFFIKGDLEQVLPFDIAVLGSMALLALIVRMPPPLFTVPQLSLTRLTQLLAALGLLSSAYIAAGFGIHGPPSLADVYGTRADFNAALEGVPAAGYLVPWTANAINPMLMTLGIMRRRTDIVVLGLLGQTLIYSVTGYKSVLFSIVLVPLVYSVVALRGRSFGLVAVTSATVILVLAVIGSSIAGDWPLTLARRVFAGPGQGSGEYFDYFSIHSPDRLSHSFLHWFVSSEYSLPPPSLIGSVKFGSASTDANGGLWADAFANFRIAGIAGFTVVAGLVLWVADGLGRGRDARVAAPLLAIAGLTMADSAFFTTMLTNGFALSCALIALMPPADDHAAPESASHARPVPLNPAVVRR